MKKLAIQGNLEQVRFGVLTGILKSHLAKKTLVSNPNEELTESQKAALAILNNPELAVCKKDADRALAKFKRDYVNMQCLKCPLADVNSASPMYPLARLKTDRHRRKSDSEKIIEIRSV